jgi:isoquinoline 1-oxidoreductase beta subunit
MEPLNCTADVRSDRCEIWTPSQGAQGVQSAAARVTGLDPSSVTVHITLLGCGWGRKNSTDFVEEAVETSMKVSGPVQLVWSREEDMRNDFYRPAALNVFQGGLDAAGRLSAVRLKVVCPPLNYANYGGRGNGADRNAVDGSANAQYAIPNFRIDYVRPDIRVPTGHWRSVGPSGNTFMLESFIDELAYAAGRDPVEFRLELLDDSPRLKHVLEVAAERSGWGTPAPEGRARGAAVVLDKGGYVAQVAEVSVERGRVRVHRVTCAVDAGQVIHTGIVEQQMVGSIVAGLTAALHGEITLDAGRVVQGNFDAYPMLVMRDMPEVDVHIVTSREEPGGVGEPGVPPIAPAVTNAIFALTGTRVRRLPIRAEELAADQAGGR